MIGLTLVLLATGAGAVLTANDLALPTARVVGGNLPVAAAATDPLDVAAHNSPTIRANPTDPDNLVVVDRVDSPRTGCAMHVSFDRGARWAETVVPVPDAKVSACFSPDLAFGPDGVLYVSFTSFAEVDNRGIVPDTVWVSTSRDGGRTLSSPVAASGPMGFQVRVIADAGTPGRAYLSWVQVSSTGAYGFTSDANPVVVSRTDDGGATWAAAVTVSPPGRARVVAPSMATGPKGRLYVAYLDVGNDILDYSGAHEGRGGPAYPGPWSLVLARSGDGGVSWSEAVVDTALVPTERFLQVHPPTPSVIVDPASGRLYLCFHDARLGDADVWVWSSDDATRWNPPRRVNDTPRGDGRAQYLPQLAIAPNGRLDVVYYDRRADPLDRYNEVSLQSSVDKGATFAPHLRLSDAAFDASRGAGADRGLPDLGNRLGLLASNAGSLAVWADTRAATDGVNKQVLARSAVAVSRGSTLRQPLQLIGYGLMAGAAFALLAFLVLSRRHRSQELGARRWFRAF
ncbi:MAG TPA: sialidase family protein [Acidimicrobiales bacterium]|nr:sialidase family protein [Acidimicrobiales bacterium]